MQIQRYFSADRSAAAQSGFFRRMRVTLADGLAVRVTAPSGWELSAVEAFAAHALLRGGVPGARQRLADHGVPADLQGCTPIDGLSDAPDTGSETDIRSAVSRVAGALARAGFDTGYFPSAETALAFRDELEACLLSRRVTLAPALWQRVGVDWAYGAGSSGTQMPRRMPDILAGAGLTSALDRARSQDMDAAALALGRNVLGDIAADIEDALAAGSAAPEGNPALRRALARANALGLPATSARRMIDECVMQDLHLPDGDGHLDFDSDIWDLFPGDAPQVVQLDRQADIGALARAAYLGKAPGMTTRPAAAHAACGQPLPCLDAPEGFVNVQAFVQGGSAEGFDAEGLAHAVRVLTIALDLCHEGSPARSTEARPIGIAPVNLAALLMSRGMAYASDEGRAMAATVTALVTASAASASADLAAASRACMSPVLQDRLAAMHRALLGHSAAGDAAPLPIPLFPYTAEQARLLDKARALLGNALIQAAETGLRNDALTCIGGDDAAHEMLAAESAGIAPMATLVRYRHLTPALDPEAIYKTISPAVPAGLRALHHDDAHIEALIDHVVGRGSLEGAPGVNHDLLRERGFTEEDIDITEAELATAANIRAVFTPYVLGWDDAILGTTDILGRLEFSDWDIEHANFHCCGALTLEGARGLPVEQLPVFDCAAPLGQIGTRCVAPGDRMLMAQAVQSFLTDGVTLDLVLPTLTSLAEIEELYERALALGLTSMRLNRDGTALSEPIDYDDLLEHAADLAGELTSNIDVRSIENDLPAETPAADADGRLMATLISVGLANGVPLSAYQEALTAIGLDTDDPAIADALRQVASGYLAGGESEAMPAAAPAATPFDPLNTLPRRTARDEAHRRIQNDLPATEAGPHEIVVSPASGPAPGPMAPSPSFGDPAYSPPSVSGRNREE